jgi:hypothetical protein
MNEQLWIWIRIPLRVLAAARAALKQVSADRHREAMVEPHKQRRSDLRAEGDYAEAQEKDLQDAQMKGLQRAGDEADKHRTD